MKRMLRYKSILLSLFTDGLDRAGYPGVPGGGGAGGAGGVGRVSVSDMSMSLATL